MLRGRCRPVLTSHPTREGTCCPIDKSTSKNGSGVSHRTQSCSRSQRRLRTNGSVGNLTPPPSFPLFLCVLCPVPRLPGLRQTREEKRRAIEIYLDSFSAYIREQYAIFKNNLKQCLTATILLAHL